LVRIREGLPK